MSGFAYLASPYSHDDEEVRIKRYMKVIEVAGSLMKAGEVIFCPIAHSCAIEHHGMAGQRMDGSFWKNQDVPILRHAEKLYVLMLPGWEVSKGIKWEIETAEMLNIPIVYLPNEILREIQEIEIRD
mgnify:CR=1 FL=1